MIPFTLFDVNFYNPFIFFPPSFLYLTQNFVDISSHWSCSDIDVYMNSIWTNNLKRCNYSTNIHLSVVNIDVQMNFPSSHILEKFQNCPFTQLGNKSRTLVEELVPVQHFWITKDNIITLIPIYYLCQKLIFLNLKSSIKKICLISVNMTMYRNPCLKYTFWDFV